MENKVILTEEETIKVQSDFFEAIYKTVSNYVEEKKIEVFYNTKLKQYSVSVKEGVKFPAILLMKAAQNTIDTNHNIYKKFVAYSTKSNKIFAKLLSQMTYYEEATIRQQFKREKFNPVILESVSQLLNIDVNMINGTNYESIISMAYKLHTCETDVYLSEIKDDLYTDHKMYTQWKKEFLADYNKLSEKEKFILYNNFDLLCDEFTFFNYICDLFVSLNEKGKNVYNVIFEALFPDTLVESRFSKFNNTTNYNTKYSRIKHLIEQADSITEKDIKNLPLKKAKDTITDNINKCAPVYYDIILDNTKLLFDTNNDDRKIALFFTTLSENEKNMITSILFHLKSNPEYTA